MAAPDLGLRLTGPGLLDTSLRGLPLGLGLVQRRLADKTLRTQFARTVQMQPGVAVLGLGLGERCPAALKPGLGLALVDASDQLAGTHRVTGLDGQARDVALDLRRQGGLAQGFDVAIEREPTRGGRLRTSLDKQDRDDGACDGCRRTQGRNGHGQRQRTQAASALTPGDRTQPSRCRPSVGKHPGENAGPPQGLPRLRVGPRQPSSGRPWSAAVKAQPRIRVDGR